MKHACLATLLVLAACGGGSGGVSVGSVTSGANVSAAKADRGTSSPAVAASPRDENAATAGPQKLDDSWASVAAEGQAFSVPGGTVVQYGAGSQWVQKSVVGPAECNAGFFGGDPSPLMPKGCFARASGQPPRH